MTQRQRIYRGFHTDEEADQYLQQATLDSWEVESYTYVGGVHRFVFAKEVPNASTSDQA